MNEKEETTYYCAADEAVHLFRVRGNTVYGLNGDATVLTADCAERFLTLAQLIGFKVGIIAL